MGQNKPTDTHTYLAPDGKYYDPTKLDTYFVSKPWHFPGDALAALKEMYADSYVKDLVYEDNPFLKMFPKRHEEEE